MSNSFLAWNISSFEQTVFHEAGHLIVLEYFRDTAMRIDLSFLNGSWGGQVHSNPNALELEASNLDTAPRDSIARASAIVTTAFAGCIAEVKFLIGSYLNTPLHRRRPLEESQILRLFEIFVDNNISPQDAATLRLSDGEIWIEETPAAGRIFPVERNCIPVGKCFWEADRRLVESVTVPEQARTCFCESVEILQKRWEEVETVAKALLERPSIIQRPYGGVPVRITE